MLYSNFHQLDVTLIMKKLLVLSILVLNPLIQYGQIIADHTVVDQYQYIPQQYIDSVKKMLVFIGGESHASGYQHGVDLLETVNPVFQALTFDGNEYLPPPSDQYLRLGQPVALGEQIYTQASTISSIKSRIATQVNVGNPYAVIGFGWCYDMTWNNDPGGTVDPVYHVRWAGSSVGGLDGNQRWGLDAGDSILTDNRINMDTYLKTVDEYNKYCTDNGYKTKFIFTTGPVDSNSGTENGFQRELKQDHIRAYVAQKQDAILFDFADILVYNNAGERNTVFWDDNGDLREHDQIHPDNRMDYDANWNMVSSTDPDQDHTGQVGTLRIAKAMWWLLARIAGWDGVPNVSDTEAPSVPLNLILQSTTSGSISFAWDNSSDNIGVAGYKIFRNGSYLASSVVAGYTDNGLQAGTSYSYTVSAFDASGNESKESAALVVSTDPASGEVSYENTFIPGFNWFSVNIIQNDMSLSNCLSMVTVDRDYIKNQVFSSTYYDGYGWFGTLEELNPRELYLLRVSEDCSVSFSGLPVDLDTAKIPVSSGWNWVGFFPTSAMSLSEALSSLNLSDQDYIKDQTSSATYYDGSGWYGTLNELVPGNGYMLKTLNSGVLSYPGNSAVKSAKESTGSENLNNSDEGLNVHMYEYNGSVTAQVQLGGNIVGSQDDKLYAYAGEQLRGVSRGMYFEPRNVYLFPLMIYSNEEAGESLSFRYYSAAEDAVYTCNEDLSFESNMIIADAYNSFEINLLQSAVSDIPAGETLFKVFPNPFSERIWLEFNLKADSEVHMELYDLSGRAVAILNEGFLEKGTHSLNLEIPDLSAGVYFIRFRSNEEHFEYRLLHL